MADTARQHLSSKIKSLSQNRQYLRLLVLLALLVAFLIACSLIRVGIALTYTEQVLDCHVAGPVAHTHASECYDDEGKLVCPLPELELHTHDASCYDPNGVLCCDLQEVTAVHEHGPGCFKEVTRRTNTLQFISDTFSTYAIVSTRIDQVLTASDGKTYQISVECPAEAEVPEGATLQVTEIVEGDEAFDTHVAETAEAMGLAVDQLSTVSLFDITIVDAEGALVEPSAPVQVTISYVEALEVEDPTAVQVVHLAEENPEVIEPTATGAEEGTVDEVSFEATSFSIYSIVTVGESAGLNGKTFALVNTYTNNALQGQALNGSSSKLAAEPVSIDSNYVTANADITFWTFAAQRNGTYYIQNDEGLYLNVDGTNNSGSVKVSNTPQALTVTAGTGNRAGQVRITNNSKIAINNYSGSTAGGFGTYNDNGNNEWFTLYDMNEVKLNAIYTADKISVQQLEDGQEVMIYRYVYSAALDSYEDYVIDGNGELVRAYDKGDQVTLRSGVSPLWKVTVHRDATTNEPNGYYDFYNEETGLYLCPQSDGTLVASRQPGVTLNGRRDGEYTSTIEAWDSNAWAWYGYHITPDEGGDLILASGTGAESQTFSFASTWKQSEGQLHPVRTVDNVAAGITIRMFDYPDRATISNVTGSDSYKVYVLPAQHASMTLNKDGYPTFKNGTSSGATLFSPSSRYYLGDANNLFMESIYNSTGYYEYSAFNNYAMYDRSTGSFTVYQETGTPSNENQFYFKRGNFFPLNHIDPSIKATNVNLYDGSGNPLDMFNPRQGSTLYAIQKEKGASSLNYYFGMTVEATFMQAKNGLVGGEPVVYEFNGDDDLWIYVDGVLVLDIGGVHDAFPGTINFATGEITGWGAGSNPDRSGRGAGGATTIKDCFKNAGVFPDGTRWDDSKVDQYFKGNTFVDYGSHDFKMFYMEHGAGASNLEMRLNLPIIERGKFTVEKELDGTSQQKFSNVYFAYQAFVRDGGEDTPLTSAVYEGTQDPVTFYPSVEINGKTYTNVFYLKPGEAATFDELGETLEYYVQELGVGTDYYDEIIVNDVRIDGEEASESDGIYPTSVATVANRARVTYTNHCSEKNLNDLRITKQLREGSVDDGSTFEFRVMLESAGGDDPSASARLTPYSTGEYYIQDAEGNYYRYENKQLTSNGKTPIVASVSGNNGTIAGIPAGYTVVISNLLAGTDFYVEEIRNPEGWVQDSKELVAGSAAPSDAQGTSWSGTPVTADGQIMLDTTAEVVITNKGDQRLVVTKEWDSGEFVTAHGNVQVGLFAQGEDGELTYVEDSLKTIAAPKTKVTYNLTSLKGFVAREVIVEDGVVTPVAQGGAVAVAGETTQFGNEATNSYVVSYEKGEVQRTDSEGASIAPTRRDTITNTMASLSLNKTDVDGHTLEGATFRLLEEDKETVVPGFESITSTGKKQGNLLKDVYLSNGTYYLEELEAPAGYVLLSHPIKVTVSTGPEVYALMLDSEGYTKVYENKSTDDATSYAFEIPNNSGRELPATGGIGAHGAQLVGVALLLAGALVLGVRQLGAHVRQGRF